MSPSTKKNVDDITKCNVSHVKRKASRAKRPAWAHLRGRESISEGGFFAWVFSLSTLAEVGAITFVLIQQFFTVHRVKGNASTAEQTYLGSCSHLKWNTSCLKKSSFWRLVSDHADR